MKPRRTPSNSNINEPKEGDTDFSPGSNNSNSTSPINRRVASSPSYSKNSGRNEIERNLSPSRTSRLSRASSSSSLKSSNTLASPDSNKSNSKYLVVGGPGIRGRSDINSGVGEGNLSLEGIGISTITTNNNNINPPELLIAEPSPTLPNDLEHFTSTPPLDSISSTSKSDFHHAASYDDIPSQYRSTSLPPIARVRATTLSEGGGGGGGRPSGLMALAGINSSPSHSETLTPSSSSVHSGKAATIDNSRPTSRSGSVNSQQYPDSLHPTSASSSRKNTLQQQQQPETTSPNSSIFNLNLNGNKNTLNSKKSKANGIAGALALSGVALASPSASLRQPLSLATRGTSYSSISNASTINGSKSPAASISGHKSPAGSIMGGGRYSHDGNEGSEAGESNYGHGGEQAFMSMDQLGDFEDVVSQLGSGYAVASSKRNTEFHTIFKNIPDDDYLIEDYGCAMQREILIQGRLYISEHHLSFNANIFGWVTSLTLPFAEIVSIEKRMTAYVIPNAIQVTTLHARHTFASFLSRDTTYDLILNIWRMIHPVIPSSVALAHLNANDYSSSSDNSNENSPIEPIGEEGTNRPNAPSRHQSNRITPGSNLNNINSNKKINTVSKMHEPTVDLCPLLKNLKEVCMDTIFPSAPEKIYNLMYTSGFMKEFWSKNLLELQISDWAPEKSGSNTLARTISYIKPLNGSIGPRQTKCLLTDENAHVDFEDYVCVITTTRTPDVPSGSAFSVKTRTSMTWAKGNSCRVVVTTGVEWTKSSFIKGIIERSCMEGQRSFYVELEKAMRAYIHQHRSEFLEEGQEPDTTSLAETSSLSSTRDNQQSSTSNLDNNNNNHNNHHRNNNTNEKNNKSKLNLETLRTGEGKIIPYLRPLIEIGTSIFDLVGDLVGGITLTSGALALVILVLVLSNIWTLSSKPNNSTSRSSSSSLSDTNKLSAVHSSGQRTPDEVASAVRSVLQDYFAGIPGTTLPVNSVVDDLESGELNIEKEVVDITALLDSLEIRILKLRGLLNSE